MAFLDEDEPFAASGRPPRRPPADYQRQIMARRAVALGVGILILVLLLLGIRGCLNARKERGFENYVRDLTAIAEQSRQLSSNFFDRLEDPGNLTELNFEAQVAANRNTAESLLDRVEGLDTPDEMAGAQSELEQAFELRRDALAGIADRISTALGTQGQREATDQITVYMRYFLASDVLYERARTEIQQVLEEEEITVEEPVPEGVFLPEPVERWLDPVEVGGVLAGVSGQEVAPGVHGLGLVQTVIDPAGTVLDPATPTTATLDGPPELAVDVQNQGDSDESDIVVSFTLSGGEETIDGEATVPRIIAGATKTARIPIESEPPTGETLTLEVTVQPVPGEEIEDNNTSTYQITFE